MSSEGGRGRRRSPGPAPGTVRLAGASKSYEIRTRAIHWKEALPWRPTGSGDAVDALVSVDLDVREGETLGLIGPNGSGKSTLLKLVAGVTRATGGQVRVGGRVGSMIELGLGFHPDLTGIENVWCSATVLGFDRDVVEDALPAIRDFSGLGAALDDPIRSYSTGMSARLGFSVATHLPVDVLAVDEVLAVGDEDFQQRCLHRVKELTNRGVTVLFVSHEMPLVAAVCERAVQLREGRLIDDGPAVEVVERYLTRVPSRFRRNPAAPLRIETSALGSPTLESTDSIEISMDVMVREPVLRPVVGVDLELPTVAPGHVWSSSVEGIAALGTRGRYRLTGRSLPMPVETGLVRVVTSLSDGGRQSLCDTAVHDIVYGGEPGKPSAPFQAQWSMEPASSQEPASGRTIEVDDAIVRLRDVAKSYRVRAASSSRRGSIHVIRALDGASLDVQRGSALGIIGPNGSGKSTLLRVVAGVTGPDSGLVEVSGRIVPVLDLGLGFHPDLTGRENLQLTSRLLELPRAGERERLDAVVADSGIGEAAERPVRTYSTGMRARLGFSFALRAEPEILLIDELLAVGDEEFRRHAVEQVTALGDKGVTVLFVSHDLRLVGEVCDRAVRVDRGRIVDDGPPDDVIARYGGPAWTSGSADSNASIRLHGLDVRRRHVPSGGLVEIQGLVEVDEGNPWARMAVSYRVAPDDRSTVLTADEMAHRTFFAATVEPAGGTLTEPGWYSYRCRIDRNSFVGRMDVVVSVLDDRDATVLSDVWQSIVVGSETADGVAQPDLRFEWSVEPLD